MFTKIIELLKIKFGIVLSLASRQIYTLQNKINFGYDLCWLLCKSTRVSKSLFRG